MLRRGLLALAGAAVVLTLVACAPASVGVPGSVPRSELGAPAPTSDATGTPARAADGAFAIGTGAIVVDAWVDFFCPYCRMFDEGNGAYLRALVERGAATLRVHPIAILDRASMGTQYSTRAANAFACVAEFSPSDSLDYMEHLYAVQPPESTPGLTDDELAEAAPSAAAGCILDRRFADWVVESTRGALEAGVRGTPTVLVNGIQYQGPLQGPAFRQFVEDLTSTV